MDPEGRSKLLPAREVGFDGLSTWESQDWSDAFLDNLGACLVHSEDPPKATSRTGSSSDWSSHESDHTRIYSILAMLNYIKQYIHIDSVCLKIKEDNK